MYRWSLEQLRLYQKKKKKTTDASKAFSLQSAISHFGVNFKFLFPYWIQCKKALKNSSSHLLCGLLPGTSIIFCLGKNLIIIAISSALSKVGYS